MRAMRIGALVVLGTALVLFSAAAAAAPGQLDLSFGSGGHVTTRFEDGSLTFALAAGLAGDGKIVAAGVEGRNGNQDQDLAVARYNADGSLDPSFGGGGTVTTNIGTASDEARGVVVQPDGKVVVAGISQTFSQRDDLVLVRYDTDGSLDPTFGNGGVVQLLGTAALSTEINAVALQPDGKIVVGGAAYSTIPQCCAGLDFLVARFNTDGSPDASFGNGGEARLSFGPSRTSDVHALAIQADGKIVAAGESDPADGSTPPDFTAARLNSDGSPDPAFGSDGNGLVRAHLDDGPATGVAMQQDGKIVLAGTRNGASADFGVVRLNADGTLDATFGTNGAVETDLNDNSNDNGEGVAVQTDGAIIVGGSGYTSQPEFALARYTPEGSLDGGFGSGGIAHTAFSAVGNYFANALALQPDGAIVLAGQAFIDGPSPGNGFGLARFQGGASDSTPPVVTGAAARPPDANGWFRSPVVIHWSAVDPDDTTVPQPADTTATTEGNSVPYTSAPSCDAAGNCATGTFAVSLDSTQPGVSCDAPDVAWHASDVSLACMATDSLSGLANAADSSFLLATSVAAGTETANAATASRSVCDVAGNCAAAGPIAGNKVDKKAPQITLTTPPAGAVYTYRQPVSAAFTCVDGGSGTAAPGFCTGTVPNGASVPTTTPGAQSFSVTARDAVGNTAPTVTNAYSVHFAFGGFYAPLKNSPAAINVVQSGRGVPVPFSLRDFSGTSIYGAYALSVFTGNSPSSSVITCPANASKINVAQTTTLSGLRYVTASAQYEYDWQTSTTWKGTCRALTLKFKDGTTHMVNFQFK